MRNFCSAAMASAVWLSLLASFSTAAPLSDYIDIGEPKLEELTIPYQRKYLENGLEVIVHEDINAPEISVYMHYKVGSSNEWKNRTGIAHLFEHLMFQGAQHIATMSENGVVNINGTTNKDYTNYYQLVPRHVLDYTLWLEARRMGGFLDLYTDELLDTQLNVVLNEKRQSESGNGANIWPRLQQAIFPKKHSYYWPVIGYERDLKSISKNEIIQWYNLFYRPNNAILVLTGNISAQEGFAKAEYYFGGIPRGPDIVREAISDKPKEKNAPLQRLKDRLPSNYVITGFAGPSSSHPDSPLLDLTCATIASPLSIVYQETVLKNLAKSMSCSYVERRLGSMLIIGFELADGIAATDFGKAAKSPLKQFRWNGPSQENLEAERASLVGSIYRLLDDNNPQGKAQLLATNSAFSNDPDHWKKTLTAYVNATPKQVSKAMHRWYKYRRLLAIVEHGPPLAPVRPTKVGHRQPARTKATLDREAAVLQATPTINKPTLRLPLITFHSVTLANGVQARILQRANTFNTHVSLSVNKSGFSYEQKPYQGLSKLTLAGLLDADTKFLQSDYSLSETEKRLSAKIWGSVQAEETVIISTAPKYNQNSLLQTLSSIVWQPQFKSIQLPRIKQSSLANIAQHKTEFKSIALQVIPARLYGENHPYGINLQGNGRAASVKTLQLADLRSWHRCQLQLPQFTLNIVTPVGITETVQQLNETFGKLEPHTDFSYSSCNEKFSVNTDQQRQNIVPPSRRQILIYDLKGLSQTAISIGQLLQMTGFPGPEVRAARYLWNEALGGGFSSRLNIELREKQAWAYGAKSSIVSQAGGQPMLLLSTSVQNDKALEALQAMEKIWFQYQQTKPAKANEIDGSRTTWKSQIIQATHNSQNLLTLMRQMTNNKLTLADLEEQFQQIGDLSPKKIKDFGKQVIPYPSGLILLVGDAKKLAPMVRSTGFEPIIIQP